MGAMDSVRDVRQRLMQSGLSNEDAQGLMPLIEMLEPVKWYARLLGGHGSTPGDIGGDRPYDTSTPLDRVVDFIPPESLAARRLAAVARRGSPAGDRCRVAQPAGLLGAMRGTGYRRELTGVSEMLACLAEQLDAHLRGREARVPDAAFEPHGEYMLPVALSLAERFSRSRACS